jgi:enoyl-[acyl-carrier protein] reductase II
MEASIALSGQVCGRIKSVEPVAKIIADTVSEFQAVMTRLTSQYALERA